MIQEEEFNKILNLVEELRTKVQILEVQLKRDKNTQPPINGNKTDIDDLLVASITAFAMETPPDGWLVCDGTEVSRIEFARLFERIGETFGNGDGSTTFNLPDLRGVSLRGWSVEGEHDPGRKFGSYQPDQMQSHKHDDK